MNTALLHTVSLLKECRTDGHAPMKFMCNDGNIYYCKYRINAKPEREIDCLFYEWIAVALLHNLNIPVPNARFIAVTDGSFDRKDLSRNSAYCKPGVVCFGSQELDGALELFDWMNTEGEIKLVNAADFVKIALFDLWVENTDRGKPLMDGGHNYNLLLTGMPGRQAKVYAFDHAFIFGGQNSFRLFNASFGINKGNKLLSTPFYNQAVHNCLSEAERLSLLNQFLQHLQANTWQRVVKEAITTASVYWPVPPDFESRIIDFLSNQNRLNLLQQNATSLLSGK